MVEARAHAAAGGGNSRGVDEGGSFYAERLCEVFEGGLNAVRGPWFDIRQLVPEDVQAFEGAVRTQGFVHARVVVGEVVVEGEFDPRGDVGEVFDLFFDQGEGGGLSWSVSG